MNAILMEGLGFGLVAVYAVFIIAMFWLMGRPQKKEQKRLQALMASLAAHDYTVDKPSFREIAPGHFVMCNDEEFERYKQQLK